LAGIQRALPQLERRSASLVAISVDEAPESRLMRRELGLSFPLLHDEAARVADSYGVRMPLEELAIPAVFVVAPDGTIAWRHIGESVPDRPTPDAVLAAIDAIGAKQPAAK
jgi:peroxiredoxin